MQNSCDCCERDFTYSLSLHSSQVKSGQESEWHLISHSRRDVVMILEECLFIPGVWVKVQTWYLTIFSQVIPKGSQNDWILFDWKGNSESRFLSADSLATRVQESDPVADRRIFFECTLHLFLLICCWRSEGAWSRCCIMSGKRGKVIAWQESVDVHGETFTFRKSCQEQYNFWAFHAVHMQLYSVV